MPTQARFCNHLHPTCILRIIEQLFTEKKLNLMTEDWYIYVCYLKC